MASTTILAYNGVTLNVTRTLRFAEACIYDESDTDLLYHEFTIRVESLATSPVGEHSVEPINTPNSAVNSAAQIHNQLMHPRGDFEYKIGNRILLRSNSNFNDPDRDVKNGPKPQACDITHIAGTRTFRIEYEIQVNVVKCGNEILPVYPGNVGGASQVLNNRWSLEDTLDSDFFWTRTWEGVLRVSHSGINPQFYRALVIPPLQAGYRRDSGTFVSSADGLHLRYTIRDKQMHAAPPPPATDWDAKYTEAAGIGGAVGHAEITVQLKGAPGSDKRALMTAAVQVIEARLGDLRKAFNPLPGQRSVGITFQGGAISEKLNENMVEAQIRVIRNNFQNRFLNMFHSNFGRFLDQGTNPIPGYDHLQHLIPTVYDQTTPAGVFAQYLQTPCNDQHAIPQVTTLATHATTVSPDSTAPDYEEYTLAGDIPDDTDEGKSLSHQNIMYTSYKIESEYMTRTGFYGLPIAEDSVAANNDTMEFVRLHGQTCLRQLRIEAERIGDWPEMPQAAESLVDPNGISEKLLDYQETPIAPSLMPDGKDLLYKMSGVYNYGLSRAPSLAERLRAGSSPIDTTTPSDNEFDRSRSSITGIQ